MAKRGAKTTKAATHKTATKGSTAAKGSTSA